MDEAQRQKLKKQLDGLSDTLNALSTDYSDLSELYNLLQQALDHPGLNPEQIAETVSSAAESLQESLPDLSGLANVAEAAQSLLGLAGELLSGLADG
jgi:chromosome segregation ATPase